MSYKYSKGAQVIGDLKAADDAERNTQIDFGEDYIGFETSGSLRMKISGSDGSITFNEAFTFPTSDGSANQVLKTDGSGQLSWANQSGGSGGAGGLEYATGHVDLTTNNKPVNWVNASSISAASGIKSWFIVPKNTTIDKVIVSVKGNNFSAANDGNVTLSIYKNQQDYGSTIVNQTVSADDFSEKVSNMAGGTTDCNQKTFSGLNQSVSEGDLIHIKVGKSSGSDKEALVTIVFDSGGGASTNAAGNDGQIQYNNGGTNFGGAAQLYYDDSNNRLGIGISSPDQSLHVQDGNILLQHNANNQFSTELQFTKSRHATDGSHTVVQTGDILGEIVFKGSDGDESVTAAAITGKVGYTTPGNNDMPGNIIFSTTQDGAASLTEAMRIDQSQGVVVKNGSLTVMGFSNGVEISGLDSGANSYNGMSFSYGAFAPGRAGIVIRGQNSTTVGTLQVRIEQDDTGSPNDVLIIGISGNATFSGTVTENSDARIKTNIRDLPNNTLSKVLQLRPVQFNRINQPNDNEDTSKEYMGFIAQEVETIFPDAVHTRTNDPDNVFGDIQDLKSIANKELIAVLTKAIQEQQEQIEELKIQVAALQN